jgi:hypothetical protein
MRSAKSLSTAVPMITAPPSSSAFCTRRVALGKSARTMPPKKRWMLGKKRMPPAAWRSPRLHGRGRVVQQGGLPHLHQLAQPGRPLAFGHQQRQAMDQRALADASRPQQDHMARAGHGQQIEQLAQQSLPLVHWIELTSLGQAGQVHRGDAAGQHIVGQHAGEGGGSQAMALQQARSAHAALRHGCQRMDAAHVDLIHGLGHGLAFVQHHQHLVREGGYDGHRPRRSRSRRCAPRAPESAPRPRARYRPA